MEGGHELRAAIIEDLAAQPRDGLVAAEQGANRKGPECDDDARANDIQLLEQERLAGLDLVGLRVPVLRRAALDDVGDIHLFAGQPDRLNDSC